MTCDVTVVIPTRNRRGLLVRTLRSVLAQEGVSFEVLVVDDGSTDGTAEAVAQLRDHRVHLIRNPSRGVSAARNAGLAQSTSPWVAFLDDDDLWAPNKLLSQLDALRSSTSARWAVSGAVNIDAHFRTLSWAAPPDMKHVADLLLAANVVPGGGSGVLVARDVATSVNGFDERLSHLADWDFYTRLALAAPSVAVFRPHVAYFVHGNGMSRDVARLMSELPCIEAKFSTERQIRDVGLDNDLFTSYLGYSAYKAGQPLLGTRLHAALLLRGRWRSIVDMAAGLVPVDLHPISSRLARRSAPLDWIEETDAWLGPFKTCVSHA